MLKFNKTFIACAFALAGLAACTRNVNVVENPNYNKATDEVSTRFVFNVSTGNTPATKQTSANTQALESETFRGMELAELIPYTLASDGKNVALGTEVATKSYELNRVLGAGEITSSSSRRVLELTLPNGTNAMLFYAKALKDGTDAAEGKISFTVDKDPANTSFGLSKRLASDKEAALGQESTLLAFIETYIVKTSIHVNVTFGGESINQDMSWKLYADNKTAGVEMSPLGEILADAFTSYTTIASDELRAGSGPALAATNGDLWTVIKHVEDATPTSVKEAAAKVVAGEIASNLAQFFTEYGTNCKWRSMSNIATSLSGISGAPAIDLIGSEDLNTFPMSYNLSAGCAQLLYDKGTSTTPGDVSGIKFSYSTTQNLAHLGGGVTQVKDIMFPAELTYFGNGPLRVSNNDHTTNDYPNGVANWDNDPTWTSDWVKSSHVTSTTRSVAMQNDINYGTALLKTTVRYGAAKIKDNKAAKTSDTEDNEIDAVAGLFSLKGLLIGGQPSSVGWDFTSKASAETYKSVIYDTELPSNAIPAYTADGAKSEPNYTLVFDNWAYNLGAAQSDVYVALEFVNNSGQDFWGKHNIVRNGGTFYIVGKLICANGGGIIWPSNTASPWNHALPPYNADGSTMEQKRVFIQDYMTSADFVLGENSLKNAYLTVPDLRSSHISLGLSVDIKWQTGLNFNDVTLGEY